MGASVVLLCKNAACITVSLQFLTSTTVSFCEDRSLFRAVWFIHSNISFNHGLFAENAVSETLLLNVPHSIVQSPGPFLRRRQLSTMGHTDQ